MPETTKISEQLTELQADFQRLLKATESERLRREVWRSGVDDGLGHLRKRLDLLMTLVNGNGHPEQGIVVRLDRVEQETKRWASYTKAGALACIAAVVSTLFAFAKHLAR